MQWLVRTSPSQPMEWSLTPQLLPPEMWAPRLPTPVTLATWWLNWQWGRVLPVDGALEMIPSVLVRVMCCLTGVKFVYPYTAICPELPALVKRIIVYSPASTPRLQGAMARHFCTVTGYQLSSFTTTRTCQSNRMWSGSSLTCQSELCWPFKVFTHNDFQLWTVTILRWSQMEWGNFLQLHLERLPLTCAMESLFYQEAPTLLVWLVDSGAHLQYALVSQ